MKSCDCLAEMGLFSQVNLTEFLGMKNDGSESLLYRAWKIIEIEWISQNS